MKRLEFLRKSVVITLGLILGFTLMAAGFRYSTILAVFSLMLVVALSFAKLKLIGQRLRDIAPYGDMVLMSGILFVGCLFTGGLVLFGLYIMPSNSIGGKRQGVA